MTTLNIIRKLAAVLLVAAMASASNAATTITYSYDAQHQLAQASYSDSQKVNYSYDAAGNLDMEVSITDAKYFRSFLLYLAKNVLKDTLLGLGRSLLPGGQSPVLSERTLSHT